PTLGFIEYLGATYNYAEKENPRALIVGSITKRVSKLETPLFIYDAVFEKNKIIEVPNNFMQVARVYFNNIALYIINVHRRAASIVKDEIFFRTHLIGMICSIIKNDPTANIIICGDYNNRGLPLTENLDDQENKITDEFLKHIASYIDPSSATYRKDIMTD